MSTATRAPWHAAPQRSRLFRHGLVAAVSVLLAACSGDGFDDLRDYMKKTEAGLPRHIEPMPPTKAYEPFEYNGFALTDPFRPRSLHPESGSQDRNAPDMNRPREILEKFPLDAVRMVGVLQQRGRTFALIRAEGTIYRVKAGDHIGLDEGVVTSITESEVTLRETVQDASGEWTSRQARLQLADAAQETRK